MEDFVQTVLHRRLSVSIGINRKDDYLCDLVSALVGRDNLPESDGSRLAVARPDANTQCLGGGRTIQIQKAGN